MNIQPVSIERFSPHTSSPETLEKMIVCYQKVFAAPPWNETWPREQVLSDLLHEVTPESSFWIARRDADVVGFCLGYRMTPPALEEKLATPFVSAFEREFGVCDIAYQDELGVLESERKQKIASELFWRRLCDFTGQGLRVGVVRTREFPEASVTFKWFTEKLGYRVLARYPGKDGRVVLGQTLSEVHRLLVR